MPSIKRVKSNIEQITLESYLKTIEENKMELSVPRAEKAFRAEFGMKPKYHKGKHGSKYDKWTCRQCGSDLVYGVCENYCNNCGYRVIWDSPRCLTEC